MGASDYCAVTLPPVRIIVLNSKKAVEAIMVVRSVPRVPNIFESVQTVQFFVTVVIISLKAVVPIGMVPEAFESVTVFVRTNMRVKPTRDRDD
jgi:hypothetical protein